jgi:hypothetical protein
VVVVKNAAEAAELCRYWWGIDGLACVSIALNAEQRAAMTKAWIEHGGQFSCIVLTPPENALILHELTRCAELGANYPNTREIRHEPGTH